METNEALVAILKLSHAQAMAGQTMSSDDIKIFMKNKVDELTSKVDACCVSESI